MNAMIPAALALAAFLTMAPAHAEEHAAPAAAAVETTTTTTTTTEVAAEVAAPVEYTLKDGTTKVSVEGDKVFVVGADGAKTAAPDGTHETTTEGVTLEVKDGALVKAATEEKAAH